MDLQSRDSAAADEQLDIPQSRAYLYTRKRVDLPARTERHRNAHVTDTGTWLSAAADGGLRTDRCRISSGSERSHTR
jgi:hypothetical protein